MPDLFETETLIAPPLEAAPIDAAPGESPETAVRISTVTETVRAVLEGAFVPLWVSGEVVDFKRHRNGHWYFCLRDESSSIRCVVWSRDQFRFPAPPDDGMQVTALGQVTLYAARGDLQLTVRAMEAEGDGLWRKALEKARLRLERDGLLDPARKRRLPRFPRRVAVITSESGAALHDIVSVASRRSPAVEVVLVPAKVQGAGAPAEIIRALRTVARWGDADVVIVGRGGGAREDLWAFNDEKLARALAACPIPTVSAVGHEIDFTLCDLVADLRAATPSAAAETVIPDHRQVRAAVHSAASALRGALDGCVDQRRRWLTSTGAALRQSTGTLVDVRRHRTAHLGAQLDALSPLATLARGYAVARDHTGRTLSSAADFVEGTSFELTVRDASIAAVTSRVSPRDA